MRVNIYAEEMTNRVEIIEKKIDGHTFTAVRFYLELPTSAFYAEPPTGRCTNGPLTFRTTAGDDDSSAVTFWGKQDLRVVLRQAIALLDEHYATRPPAAPPAPVTHRDL